MGRLVTFETGNSCEKSGGSSVFELPISRCNWTLTGGRGGGIPDVMRFASFHSARSAYERREKSGMPGRLVISGLPSLSGIFQHSIAYLRVAGRVITRKITESRDPDLKENRCAWINFPSPCIASFEYESSLVKQISILPPPNFVQLKNILLSCVSVLRSPRAL